MGEGVYHLPFMSYNPKVLLLCIATIVSRYKIQQFTGICIYYCLRIISNFKRSHSFWNEIPKLINMLIFTKLLAHCICQDCWLVLPHGVFLGQVNMLLQYCLYYKGVRIWSFMILQFIWFYDECKSFSRNNSSIWIVTERWCVLPYE